MLIKAIKQGFRLLSDPENEFKRIKHRTFEQNLSNYLILLLTVGVMTGIVSFLFYLIKAAYLDIFMTIDIQYIRMINYSLGRATSLMFFYLFAGTFFVFIMALILSPFFKKIKFTRVLELIFYSLTPLLLFSWIPILSLSLLIWSIFLLVTGIKMQRFSEKINVNSIEQRD